MGPAIAFDGEEFQGFNYCNYGDSNRNYFFFASFLARRARFISLPLFNSQVELLNLRSITTGCGFGVVFRLSLVFDISKSV